jgi:uncharacterized protein (TIGR02996 family)
MSDRDALLAAIREQPDEDTPRLVFADYLQENGDEHRAAFIRAQVELARTPPWEPFAAFCRWRQPDLASGSWFRDTLPRADGRNVEWPAHPFRRGFAWSIRVKTPSLWHELAEPIIDREPVGSVRFWDGATLDDWRRIASSGCVRHLRELELNGNPIEPLRALRDRPAACGVADVRFHRASGAGMPEVLEALSESPMGRAVRGLHFHVGYESREALIDAVHLFGPLRRLSFSVMGIAEWHVRPLLTGPAAASLEELHLDKEPGVGDAGLQLLMGAVPPTIRDLTLSGVGMRAAGMEALSRCERLPNLRRLSLRGNPFEPRAMRVLSLSRSLPELRSLDLTNCHVGDKGVRHLTRTKFWPNLVELNLRGNEISTAGVRHLLNAPVPPDLTALVLDGGALNGDNRAALVRKYGDAVVFAASELPA